MMLNSRRERSKRHFWFVRGLGPSTHSPLAAQLRDSKKDAKGMRNRSRDPRRRPDGGQPLFDDGDEHSAPVHAIGPQPERPPGNTTLLLRFRNRTTRPY